MALTSTSLGGRLGGSERRRANGPRGVSGSVSFAALVREHQRWRHDAATTDAVPESEGDAYYERVQKFERAEGKIQGAYWCTCAESAVALTVKAPSGRFRVFRPSLSRIHRVSDWAVPENGEPIAELLHYCDALAIKASAVLAGTPARIVMQWIFAIESDLLGFIERSGGVLEKREVTAFCSRVRKELAHVERYYDDAGNKTARLAYFFGMVSGVVLLTGLGALIGLFVWLFGVLDSDRAAQRTIFVCLAAGGVGAVVSVLTRMTGEKFRLDYEIGRTNAFILGSFRPFLGSIFGLALYALLGSKIFQLTPPTELPQAYYFYGTLAFLAGFNERWAQVMFSRAERTIDVSLEDDAESAAAPAAGRNGGPGAAPVSKRVDDTSATS